MAVPVINVIKSFDATEGSMFTFSYTGNQPVNMQYVIYRADTLEEIYRNIDDTAFLAGGIVPVKLQGTIPPDSGIENGLRYYLRVRVIDVFRTPSDWSASSYFTCIEKASLTFVGLESGDKIKTQTLTVTVNYSQSNDEKLQSYWFNLYDEYMNVVQTSKIFYDVPIVDGVVTLSYTFTNLSDDTIYYVKCSGSTVRGMSCESDLIQIEVDYKFYDDFSLLYLSNDRINGRIEYQANFIIVLPDEYYDEFEYEDSYIHLEDKELNYNKGFNLEDDFIIWLKGKVPYKSNTFLILYNQAYEIILESIVYDGYMKYKMTVRNGLDNYILYSASFAEFDDYAEDFVWCIKRVAHVYQFAVYTTTTSMTDVLVSKNKPDAIYAKNGIAWINGEEVPLVHITKNNIYTSENEPSVSVPSIWIGGDK